MYEKESGSRKYKWIQGKSLEEIEKLDKLYSIADMDEVEGCAICHL